MKKILTITLFIFVIFTCGYAQEDNDNYLPPEFIGGNEKFKEFISENIDFPPLLFKKNKIDTVLFLVQISKNGNVDEITTIISTNSILEKMTLEMIESLPNFHPAFKNDSSIESTLIFEFNSFLLDTNVIHCEIGNLETTMLNIFLYSNGNKESFPVFPGGQYALHKFLSDNLEYPDEAMCYGFEGKVLIRFNVSETGKVRQINVLRSVAPVLDNEAIRVVKMLPYFTPASMNGKFVPINITVPIIFTLPSKRMCKKACRRIKR
ncbi:MAG: energy transducer TonB [Bacteroidota bacterium]|nr:energy transducer TonB [Bacteroidota bacterium]